MNKNAVIGTSLYSVLVILVVYWVQKSNESVVSQCSYLDPITIDILAFSAAMFLIIEGFTRIITNPASWKVNVGRAIRVGFGFAIVTIHLMQFLHK